MNTEDPNIEGLNNKRPEPSEDDRLNQLLRDVPIPADLKKELRLIPKGQQAASFVESRRAESRLVDLRHSRIAWLSIATAMLAMASLLVLVNRQGTNNHHSNTAQNPNQPIGESDKRAGGVDKTLTSVDQGASRIDELRFQLLQLRLKVLTERLQSENETRVEQDRIDLTRLVNQDELKSISEAVAGQSALYLNGDVNTVRENMRAVVANYPDSKGSLLAEQFLSNN